MIARKLNIKGHVQGVFFRRRTMDKASELGINGTVRNCKRDRRVVKIHAEGEEDVMKLFIDWCHEGPPDAIVEEVEMQDVAAKGMNGFSITE